MLDGRGVMGVVDDEAALCALLTYLGENDDPAIADRAIALYLARFGDDAEAKALAIGRLTRMLVEWPASEEAADDDAPTAFRQTRPG